MRRVPQFEDAFQETLVRTPVKLPDRSYSELYQSQELNFIGRPFEDLAKKKVPSRHLKCRGAPEFLEDGGA